MTVQVFDSEIYRDYFLAMFRDVATGELHTFELFDGQPFDSTAVHSLLKTSCLVTFNGINFDLPLLLLALKGASPVLIKQGSDAIINGKMKPWDFERQYGVRTPRGLDHIDLIEVAPGKASLKIYGGRLHVAKLQDLPFDPSASIAPEQRAVLREYCGNDLLVTQALYTHLLPQIALRQKLGLIYGMDLRSKSDAQIAESVIVKEVSRILGGEVQKPMVEPGTAFRYVAAPFVKFATSALQAVARTVASADFVVPSSGSMLMPKELSELNIKVGAGTYRIGIGGLHSTESSVAHVADAGTRLIDRDVASYYPAIILSTGLAPDNMGEAFTHTFRKLATRRLEAKRAGDTVTADSLKITVNGAIGKFGSPWSNLYAPALFIQTTLTGQLALLMLIEALECEGIPVVSANTDGVVIKCPVPKTALMECVVWEWEELTGFETEATEYNALYSRDVNNYIALKKGGGVKLKGVYAPAGIHKNPANEICTGAVVKYLAYGTPVAQSIAECQDIRKFVTVRAVKGGAVKDGEYLGKAVRWYYACAGRGAIQYKLNGYTVARTEGAQPLMALPSQFPGNVDLDWYTAEAHAMLADVGVHVAGLQHAGVTQDLFLERA